MSDEIVKREPSLIYLIEEVAAYLLHMGMLLDGLSDELVKNILDIVSKGSSMVYYRTRAKQLG